MKLLPQLCTWLDKSYTPAHFDLLYRVSRDPYGVEYSPYERQKRGAAVECAACRYYRNALDIGCGTGLLTSQIARYCSHMLGIDFSPRAIALAQDRFDGRHGLSFAVEDIRTFHRPEAYDLFVCSEVLCYLDDAALEDVGQRLAGLSAEDAWLLLVGCADDERAIARLGPWFRLIDRVEDRGWRRPYAASLLAAYQLPDVA